MAISEKITQSPAATVVNAADLIPIVHDPGGTPVTQKATVAQLQATLNQVVTYAGNPNGNVMATGVAIVIGSGITAGQIWVKVTAGTTNNEWNQII